jgi:hypothetical protein
MKKRTVCFGWTKKFQRRIENARRWLNISASASDATTAHHFMARANAEMSAVKSDHRKRVMALQGGAA